MRLLNIFIFILASMTACQASEDEKKGQANGDEKACTLLGALGSLDISVEATALPPPHLIFKRGLDTLASECDRTGTMQVERNNDGLHITGYLLGQDTPENLEIDVFASVSCMDSDLSDATLVKAGIIANLSFAEVTVYPNGPDCGGQKVNNGTGTISLD